MNHSENSPIANATGICTRDADFLSMGFETIEGWCLADAAQLTCLLLDEQQRYACPGDFAEIGVYKGRYFSVLCYKAREQRRSAIGIDAFLWSSPEEVSSSLARAIGGSDGVAMFRHDSRELDASRMRSLLPSGASAFMSIDGDHTPAGVYHDIGLAFAVLSPAGIIAIDDFLNPRAIGVSEGAYRFFLGGTCSLKPFAYCANKLFVCRDEYYQHYKDAVFGFLQNASAWPAAQEFMRLLGQGRHWVEQELLGAAPWII